MQRSELPLQCQALLDLLEYDIESDATFEEKMQRSMDVVGLYASALVAPAMGPIGGLIFKAFWHELTERSYDSQEAPLSLIKQLSQIIASEFEHQRWFESTNLSKAAENALANYLIANEAFDEDERRRFRDSPATVIGLDYLADATSKINEAVTQLERLLLDNPINPRFYAPYDIATSLQLMITSERAYIYPSEIHVMEHRYDVAHGNSDRVFEYCRQSLRNSIHPGAVNYIVIPESREPGFNGRVIPAQHFWRGLIVCDADLYRLPLLLGDRNMVGSRYLHGRSIPAQADTQEEAIEIENHLRNAEMEVAQKRLRQIDRNFTNKKDFVTKTRAFLAT